MNRMHRGVVNRRQHLIPGLLQWAWPVIAIGLLGLLGCSEQSAKNQPALTEASNSPGESQITEVRHEQGHLAPPVRPRRSAATGETSRPGLTTSLTNSKSGTPVGSSEPVPDQGPEKPDAAHQNESPSETGDYRFKLKSLANAGDSESVTQLLRGLQNPTSEDSRKDLLDALATVTNIQSMNLLWDALRNSTDTNTDRACQLALAHMSGEGFAANAQLLYDAAGSPEAQTKLLEAISLTSDATATGPLTKMAQTCLANGHSDLAVAATYGLARISSIESESSLISIVSQPEFPADGAVIVRYLSKPESLSWLVSTASGQSSASTSLRLNAIQALQNYPQKKVLPALNSIATSDPDAQLRQAAQDALKR